MPIVIRKRNLVASNPKVDNPQANPVRRVGAKLDLIAVFVRKRQDLTERYVGRGGDVFLNVYVADCEIVEVLARVEKDQAGVEAFAAEVVDGDVADLPARMGRV